jgi:hypothetical protein
MSSSNSVKEEDETIEITSNSQSANLVERTIVTMEVSHVLCYPSSHHHSFQATSFLLLQSCAGCHARIGAFDSAVVKCAACGAVAHRACANSNNRAIHWDKQCSVNQARLVLAKNNNNNNRQRSLNNDNNDNNMSKEIDARNDSFEKSGELINMIPDSEEQQQQTQSNSSVGTDASTAASNFVSWAHAKITREAPAHNNSLVDTPMHVSTIALPKSDSMHNDDDELDMAVLHAPSLHYANHPFASISKALQENIAEHFKKQPTRVRSDYPGNRSLANKRTESCLQDQTDLKVQVKECAPQTVLPSSCTTTITPAPIEAAALTSHDAHRHSLSRLAADTFQTICATVAHRPVAAVAGGIAGGMAGLAIAGPAGAYAGVQFGTAGALGVILEGSVSIGVFVASVATAGYTAQQLHEIQEQRRVLTMGEDGTCRKVLLVRPNVRIDPVWEQIVSDVRKNALPAFVLLSKDARDRYRHDADIVVPNEEEIPTTDKVLLLVSRTLSDKTSLPGYVYRELIAVFETRCSDRQRIVEMTPSISAMSPRARRDDAHAVIKYVTATLLEVRPGFGMSASLTELTATAVEGLVFAQLYSKVFDEIVMETLDRDESLRKKIADFHDDDFHAVDCQMTFVTDEALAALRMLPESCTAVEKLRCCVDFLEQISINFLNASPGSGICADSLLKIVCQHIIAANVSNLNAEVAFLEEFARDEQLLRGREGYSLVTLQASLHFLNMSENLETDIFGQDDDEENVPAH